MDNVCMYFIDYRLRYKITIHRDSEQKEHNTKDK